MNNLSRHLRSELWILLFLIVTSITLPGTAPAQDSVQIQIDSGQPQQLDEVALRKLPLHAATLQGHDGAIALYQGASLHEVLKQSGAAAGSQVKGQKMPAYVLAQGADGYQAVFSLAELDPAFRESFAIVAYQRDGKPLDAKEGPIRLVIPEDRKMARSVRNLARLQVVTLPPPRGGAQ